jgi:site-specific DNA recombinase
MASIENMLKNPIYAGYIQSKYTNGIRYTGLHQALITNDIFEKNQRILAGKNRIFIKSDESDYPLRRDFLKCAYCNKFVTASAPRGNGGKYPRYSCITCRASVVGKKVGKSSEEIHKEFRYILSRIRYKDGRLKLFKQIVLTRWCDEYDDALKSAHEINQDIDKLRQERSSTIRKFTRDQISFEDKETVVKDIDKEIGLLEDKKIQADIYADQREKIIDNALLFIKDPSEFWNRAPVQIQKRVQHTIFPEGLTYDFEKGFGTVKVNESYQLIKKIASEEAIDSIVVAMTGFEPVTPGL